MRANVISSRSFNRPAMFDLELESTVGVGGGGRARRGPLEEAVGKHPRVIPEYLRVTAFPEMSKQPIKMS